MATIRFQLVAPDHEYETAMLTHGGVNGGTVWIHNIADALRWHGHKAEVCSINADLNADFVIIQSESMKPTRDLNNYHRKGGKIICLLGHFKPAHNRYISIPELQRLSSYIFTPWEGALLDDLAGSSVHFMPHAYNDLQDDKVSIKRAGSIVFAGNTYPLRDEYWFSSLHPVRIYRTMPKDLFAIYRGADVCLNLHGNFQKNIVSNEISRLSDKSGMMINERFWQILGSGGLLVTDYVPQMDEFFEPNELIIGYDNVDYCRKVKTHRNHKEEGLKLLEAARNKVRKYHTYKERVKEMLCLIS